jgi:hypothetical protein
MTITDAALTVVLGLMLAGVVCLSVQRFFGSGYRNNRQYHYTDNSVINHENVIINNARRIPQSQKPGFSAIADNIPVPQYLAGQAGHYNNLSVLQPNQRRPVTVPVPVPLAVNPNQVVNAHYRVIGNELEHQTGRNKQISMDKEVWDVFVKQLNDSSERERETRLELLLERLLNRGIAEEKLAQYIGYIRQGYSYISARAEYEQGFPTLAKYGPEASKIQNLITGQYTLLPTTEQLVEYAERGEGYPVPPNTVVGMLIPNSNTNGSTKVSECRAIVPVRSDTTQDEISAYIALQRAMRPN